MDSIERIKEILKVEGIKRKELTTFTTIDYERWQSVLNRRTKLRHEEIEAIGKAFPEYKLWIAYGEELPEAGQISPMTKKAQQDLGQQGKVGG